MFALPDNALLIAVVLASTVSSRVSCCVFFASAASMRGAMPSDAAYAFSADCADAAALAAESSAFSLDACALSAASSALLLAAVALAAALFRFDGPEGDAVIAVASGGNVDDAVFRQALSSLPALA